MNLQTYVTLEHLDCCVICMAQNMLLAEHVLKCKYCILLFHVSHKHTCKVVSLLTVKLLNEFLDF